MEARGTLKERLLHEPRDASAHEGGRAKNRNPSTNPDEPGEYGLVIKKTKESDRIKECKRI